MKRVAVCLSGLVRTFEMTHQNLYDQLLAINPDCQFDFFLSTWSNSDSRKSSQQIRLERWGHSAESFIQINQTPVDRLEFIYKPIMMNVEQEKSWDVAKYTSNKDGWASPEAWLGMTYKIADCDRLRREHQEKEGFVYDIVIRHRFDVLLPCPIPLDMDVSRLHVPKMWAETYHNQPWTNDMFAIGSDEIMTRYSKAHESTDSLFDRGVIFQPEILLYNHLAINNIPVVVMDFDLTILRN